MRKKELLIACAFAAGLLAVSAPILAYPFQPNESLAGYTVKLERDGGHGSGVHVGNGYVITAAHVVVDGKVEAKFDNGARRDVEVLWANKDYDVALLRMPDMRGIQSIPISCAPMAEGTQVTLRGSPLAAEFMATRGTVSGVIELKQWRVARVVDATIVQGMSGGPVVHNERVVGISAGVMVAPVGPFSASITGLGIIVPSTVICTLLGR